MSSNNRNLADLKEWNGWSSATIVISKRGESLVTYPGMSVWRPFAGISGMNIQGMFKPAPKVKNSRAPQINFVNNVVRHFTKAQLMLNMPDVHTLKEFEGRGGSRFEQVMIAIAYEYARALFPNGKINLSITLNNRRVITL